MKNKMKKLTGTLLMSIMILSSFTLSFADEDPISIYIDGQEMISKFTPFVDSSNRTQVPISFIAQELGAKVAWIAETNQVEIVNGNDTIILTIDSNIVNINGQDKTIDSKAVTVNGRTYVPLAFISDQLGANIKWEQSTFTVFVTTKDETQWSEDGTIKEEIINEGVTPDKEVVEGERPKHTTSSPGRIAPPNNAGTGKEINIKDYYEYTMMGDYLTQFFLNNFKDGQVNKRYILTEVAYEDLEVKIDKIVPLKSNMIGHPTYVVDMGLAIDNFANESVTYWVIDKEGRLWDMSKISDKRHTSAFMVSTEVEYIIECLGADGNRRMHIAKITPTIKTGYTGDASKDTTTEYLQGGYPGKIEYEETILKDGIEWAKNKQ